MLEKIVDGLKLVKTQQSPSECKAVLSSFMDCVKYFTSFESRHWQIEIDQNHIEQFRTDVINMVSHCEFLVASWLSHFCKFSLSTFVSSFRFLLSIFFQLNSVIEMSLNTQRRLSCSLLYERLADFLQDTAENQDIQDHFWEGFNKLIQDKTLRSEKVILEHVSCVYIILYLPSNILLLSRTLPKPYHRIPKPYHCIPKPYHRIPKPYHCIPKPYHT